MRIGELASAAGVAVSTVRFYERRRLVLPSARTGGNYRQYDASAVDRVRFIQRAQRLGFTLADVELLLRLSSGQVVRRAQLDAIATHKLAELDSRIEDLRRVRRGLLKLLAQPCIDLEAPCPVIGALANAPSTKRRREDKRDDGAVALRRPARSSV